MKTGRRLLFWIIGCFLAIISIGGYANGDYLAATLCLVIGLLLIPPIREKVFSKKLNGVQPVETKTILVNRKDETKNKVSIKDAIKVTSAATSENEMTITLDLVDENKLMQLMQQNENEKQERIKNFQYIPQQVSGIVIQTLESISIMDNTKNFDTLKGRYQFVKEKIDFLKLASSHKRYLSDVQGGLDQYKTLYYDRIPTQLQIAALLKPNDFNYDEFYCKCILNSFQRFYDEQNEQIVTLKKEEAIKRRREKIMDTIREIQNHIPTMAESFSEAYENLEKIYQKVYHETYG